MNEELFYSEKNMKHLRRGIKAFNTGEGTEHELIEDDPEILPSSGDKEPFYSDSNMKALNESIEQMKQGKTITKTFEELEAMENGTA